MAPKRLMHPATSHPQAANDRRTTIRTSARSQAQSQQPSEEQQLAEENQDGPDGQEFVKKGRGPAAGCKEWGEASYKLHLTFNEYMQVCGENSTEFATRLGIIAKCGVRLPLHYSDWRKVPDYNKNAVWKEIQDNTDAPDTFKRVCLITIGSLWRNWKGRVKKDYYVPFKDDPDIRLKTPSDARVKQEDWEKLVDRWRLTDVQEESTRNKGESFNIWWYGRWA